MSDYEWTDVTPLQLPERASFSLNIKPIRQDKLPRGDPLPRVLKYHETVVECRVWIAPRERERILAARARLRWRKRRALLLWLYLRWYQRMVASN